MGVKSAAEECVFLFKEYFYVDWTLRRARVSPGIVLLGSRALHNLSKLMGGASVQIRHVSARTNRRA